MDMVKFKPSNDQLVQWSLRLGLALVFIYAGVGSLLHPYEWIAYLPGFLTRHFAALTLIKLFAVFELLLAAWLLSGKLIKYCGIVCGSTLVLIVLFNLSQLIITFRDIGLVFMALALVFVSYKRS
ncbi:hypothetical protein M1512_01450 [Patescibacteria group bacterium]|jgi:uncharacterized membrane protein YphA (DoxX/SURF4 family)|nr:hypothetical protein [Patescibacteria group bacterium]